MLCSQQGDSKLSSFSLFLILIEIVLSIPIQMFLLFMLVKNEKM